MEFEIDDDPQGETGLCEGDRTGGVREDHLLRRRPREIVNDAGRGRFGFPGRRVAPSGQAFQRPFLPPPREPRIQHGGERGRGFDRLEQRQRRPEAHRVAGTEQAIGRLRQVRGKFAHAPAIARARTACSR